MRAYSWRCASLCVRSLLGEYFCPGFAEPIPASTSRSTDVTTHKRATPKTSLLSCETCRSFSFLSIFFMSINYRCPCGRVRYCCWMKKRNLMGFCAGSFFVRHKKLQNKYMQKSAQKYLQKPRRHFRGEPSTTLLWCHYDVQSGAEASAWVGDHERLKSLFSNNGV